MQFASDSLQSSTVHSRGSAGAVALQNALLGTRLRKSNQSSGEEMVEEWSRVKLSNTSPSSFASSFGTEGSV